jgi:tyrosyl-tRNA synthetase
MNGDPSGKSDERNLLDEATLNHNVEGIKGVSFLRFQFRGGKCTSFSKHYDWMKRVVLHQLCCDVGKRITVNYMMAKDSVKKRLAGEEGMSLLRRTN